MDNNSLAHTKWDCKYHLVFAPKYRRQVIYKDIKADVGQILGTLCRRKGIEIIEAQCMPDHIHMLVSIPPKYSVSEVVGYLKGKSSLMIFEKHANLKYKYGNRHFWCRGYYVDTVGKNTAAIKAYIQNQIKEDFTPCMIRQAALAALRDNLEPFLLRTIDPALCHGTSSVSSSYRI